MIPTKRLIQGMRDAVKYLENKGNDYRHSSYSQCLIGVLTQVTSNLTKEEVKIYSNTGENNINGYYSDKNNIKVCPTTGIPLNEIYKHLYSLGIQTQEDLMDIEYAGTFDKYYSPTKEDAIDYFLRKADELEVQLLNQSVPVKATVKQSVGI